MRRLLDRELGDVEHRAAEPAVDRLRVLELLVDLVQLGVARAGRASSWTRLGADLGEPLRVDRQADDLRRVDLEQRRRRLDPFTIGTFAVL